MPIKTPGTKRTTRTLVKPTVAIDGMMLPPLASVGWIESSAEVQEVKTASATGTQKVTFQAFLARCSNVSLVFDHQAGNVELWGWYERVCIQGDSSERKTVEIRWQDARANEVLRLALVDAIPIRWAVGPNPTNTGLQIQLDLAVQSLERF